MCAQQRDDDLDREVEQELVRRLGKAESEHRPAEVTLGGRRYRLVLIEDDRTSADRREVDRERMPEAASLVTPGDDPFRNYDPERVLAALEAIRESGGALKGLDIEAFMEEIMESRIQDTPGHRWP